MTETKIAMIALDTLENQASHTVRILHNNGFESTGIQKQPDVAVAVQAVFESINRLKQIVLLDGYQRDVVTIPS
jgi:hypothetical protein